MKLYYYKRDDGISNFGDTLNAWLWPQLIPEVLDEDETEAFVGIGTLINQKLPKRTPKAHQRIIFTTGAGKLEAGFALDESYQVYCVRGPLSAQALNLCPTMAIADGAILVRRLVSLNSAKPYSFAYMPHHRQADDGWAAICQDLGFGFIDPRWPVEKILTAIGQTEVLLSEAMHGAIVADALRVGWIPVVTTSSIYTLKWLDWCQSLNLEYRPIFLPRPPAGSTQPSWLGGLRSPRGWWQFQQARAKLLQTTQTVRFSLSHESDLEVATVRLEAKLEQLKREVNPSIV